MQKLENNRFMKKTVVILSFLLLVLISGFSCADGGRVTRTDTPTSGVAEIVADECLLL